MSAHKMHLGMGIGFLLVATLASAQSATTGAIAGLVKDATGAVLPGVTVEAASPALIEKVRSVITDDKGQYKIVDLRPGLYSITFTLPGFSTFKREGIELTTGFTVPANADLKVGSLEETVTVTGASPVVDIQNVRTQNQLSRQALDAIPTNKTVQGFATLTLGAVVTAGTQDVGGNRGEFPSAISVHGSRVGDMKLLQDGMRYNQGGGNGGAARQYLPNQVAVQEVTLEINGMSAESETGGVQMNLVPKDGGNVFTPMGAVSYANSHFQADNLTNELRALGLTVLLPTEKIWDYGVGFGGPIRKDKLWFYTAHRTWGAHETVPGMYYNTVPDSLFYVPDLSRPGVLDNHQRDHSARLTWQAAPKHKLTLSFSGQANCLCVYDVGDQNAAPEATIEIHHAPTYLTQVTWNHPASNKVLFEAGYTYGHNIQDSKRPPGVSADDIPITELSTGLRYNAKVFSLANHDYGDGQNQHQSNGRVSVSYVTGSHAFKSGLFFQRGMAQVNVHLGSPLSYSFRNGLPVSLTEWATPRVYRANHHNLALFSQDQWTIKRMTLNLGVRFDRFNGFDPEGHSPAGPLVPAFDYARVSDVPNFSDIAPRIGVAYDLFGNGKTAFKAFIGRYAIGLGAGLAQQVHPVNTVSTNTARNWGDTNGNFIPDCDLQNRAANGECGAISNNAFGTSVVSTVFSDDVLHGFAKRPYHWEASVTVQHELWPGIGLTAGYFRSWFGNFTVTDNQSVTGSDYNTYCVAAPTDPLLPGGGGNQLCGLFDLNPAKLGQVNNLVVPASEFGQQTEVFNGVDLGFNARFGKQGLLQGGVSVGRTVTNNCFVVDSPQQARPGFCNVTPPWNAGTQFKLNGVYPLPGGFEISGTFQNLAGIPRLATYVATNAQIAPSLGRNLASGAGGTATIDLIPANSQFEDRLTQVDLRFTKTLRVGRGRVRGMFDLYNVLNASTVLVQNGRFGTTWRKPARVLGGRLFKLGAQVDF